MSLKLILLVSFYFLKMSSLEYIKLRMWLTLFALDSSGRDCQPHGRGGVCVHVCCGRRDDGNRGGSSPLGPNCESLSGFRLAIDTEKKARQRE